MIVPIEELEKNMALMFPSAKAALDEKLSYHVALKHFQIALMHEALVRSEGVIADAAYLLGVNRNWASTLVAHGRLQKLVKPVVRTQEGKFGSRAYRNKR